MPITIKKRLHAWALCLVGFLATGASAQSADYSRESGVRIASNCASSQVLKLANGQYRAYCSSGGQITSSISSDGLEWRQEPGTRLIGGVNPAVFALADGSFRMIYGVQTQNPFGETLYSAVSTDGLNFRGENGVRLAPSAEENGVVSVPDVVRMPNGQMRMYYTSSKAIGAGAKQPGIRSALSADEGLTWIRDEGWRVGPGSFATAGVMDPSVVQLPDGTYRMFVTYQGLEYPPAGSSYRILSASSNDGLSFTPDTGLRLQGAVDALDANGIADPYAVLLPNGAIRLYFNTVCPLTNTAPGSCSNQVLSATSGPAVNVNAITNGTVSNMAITVAANALTAAAGCAANELWIVAIPTSGPWLYFGTASWSGSAQRWGTLNGPTQVEVLRNFDLTPYRGAGLYAGYGCSIADIVDNQRYARVYSVN